MPSSAPTEPSPNWWRATSPDNVLAWYFSALEYFKTKSLTCMGLVLGNRLAAGANNQLVIDQLMGIAIEKKFLGQLDPATNYDLLGRFVQPHRYP